MVNYCGSSRDKEDAVQLRVLLSESLNIVSLPSPNISGEKITAVPLRRGGLAKHVSGIEGNGTVTAYFTAGELACVSQHVDNGKNCPAGNWSAVSFVLKWREQPDEFSYALWILLDLIGIYMNSYLHREVSDRETT